jgi:hypothetical protein
LLDIDSRCALFVWIADLFHSVGSTGFFIRHIVFGADIQDIFVLSLSYEGSKLYKNLSAEVAFRRKLQY